MFVRRLSLRGKFAVWTSVIVAASLLALLVTVYVLSSRMLRAAADQELDRIVAKTAEELDLWIGSRERDAVNLAELEEFRDACSNARRGEAQQALLRIHQRSPFYENVFLADAHGKLFLDSIGGKSVGVDLSTIPGYRPNVEHARRHEAWVGEVMKSPATGRPVALITAPILAAGQVVGMLGTPIELTNFSENFVNRARIRESGYVYMFDGAGTVLAHPEAAKILASNVSSTSFGREMLARGEGSISYETGGEATAARFRRAQRKPWTIATAVPARELLASVRTMQVYLTLLGLVSLAGTVLAVAYLAGRTSRSVQSFARELNAAAGQFFATSSQIAAASQSLSAGASEQAASIEETSASATEISSITQQNQDRSARVARLMEEAMPIVHAVNAAHQELAAALGEMNQSNQQVARVIKMIDEIAFQTNILALNAAVEAARAGEAGMGFAVVADEVRSLAQRSAKAAQETSQLIEGALAKSQQSRGKLDRVLQSMEANNQITEAVRVESEGIRAASAEQAQGIAQVSMAIEQMSLVTQRTAAEASENASAAAGLNAQATRLAELARRLSTTASGAGSEAEPAETAA